MIRLGVIGYGGRGAGMARLMERLPYGARLTAVADVDSESVRRRLAKNEKDPSSVRFYEDADRMLQDEQLDGVLVATRCSLHAEMAVKVLARNIPLFLEKPVATSLADHRRLADAGLTAQAPVVVSFPLRLTPVAQAARRLIDAGRLGEVTHVQATNDVPYGEVYYQTWYRNEGETGGLFLQKATHDFDAINFLLGDPAPVRVAAMTSKLVFRGNRPAGLKCVDCDDRLTCLESKFNPTAATGAGLQAPGEEYLCAFGVDTGNEDSGNAIVEYRTGAQANYTQNFYSRRGAATRKIRAIGHRGTIEFDWVTEVMTLWVHHQPVVETHDCRTKGEGHGGGDSRLAANFLQVVRGEAESLVPLSAGLQSALICLLARESARTGQFQDAVRLDAR